MIVCRCTAIVGALLLLTAVCQAEEAEKSPLEGTWKVTSAKYNGSNYLLATPEKMIVTFHGDEIRIQIEGTDSEQGAKFVLRSDKSPAEIDFIKQTRNHAWNNGNPATLLFRGWKLMAGNVIPAEDRGEGIYQLENDKLTLCWRTNKHKELVGGKVSPAEPVLRPTVFQSHLYYGQYLFVMERMK